MRALPKGAHTKRRGQTVTKSKDTKRHRAELLGMPVGTAEKHLRKSIIHELAHQLGKNVCCRCGLAIEEPDDLAIVHVQDWEDEPDLYWALTNIAFSHAGCEAARSGKRQREKKQMSKVEVRVEDPTGQSLLGARHEGDLWVAGKKGSRYQIRVRNKTKQSLLVVVTVDGRNVISGEPGDHQDRGHVLAPKQTHIFRGWRTSSSTVAAFEFGKKKDAYSSVMGTPENVGVIGVAVFEEKAPEPVIKTVKETTVVPWPVPVPVPSPVYPYPWPYERRGGWWGIPQVYQTPNTYTGVGFSYGGGYTSGGGTYSSSAPFVSSSVAPPAPPEPFQCQVPQHLGTTYGESLESVVRNTKFQRATEDPCEVILVRYDAPGALRARGILVKPSKKREDAPQAFPRNEGYCTPPTKHKRASR